MSFGDFPDLGKIGKRIGKQLRDILNGSVDDGPSKEERLAQRLLDSLRGLVYFDSFDEIEKWDIEDVDPVQQGNTPLLERAACQVYDQSGPTSRVLLCHDYSGGYHDWEGVHPVAIKEEPYSCNYLQYVETFVYFSHKVVCIPPSSWVNTCHRHGVKVLGTFMMEGDAHAKSIEKMFHQVNGEYVVARQLANMAHAYGFDGWLLNIETEFPYNVQHPISNLTAFIRTLKRSLGANGCIIWYDAITKDNEVDYQNALTWKNVEFALTADALFTNYKWTERKLHETKAVAEQHGIRSAEIYFGVDVWAQNTNMPGPPRVTYPPNGGGGTLTGLAAHVLAQEDLSTAIFAPAWPYEHFTSSTDSVFSTGGELHVSERDKSARPTEVLCSQGPKPVATESFALAVERAMWEGMRLPNELQCDCKKGHPHHAPGYRDTPITSAAREYPAGSSSFLETNFEQAFRRVLDNDGTSYEDRCSWISKLGCQAPFPPLWKHKNVTNSTLHAELQYDDLGFPLMSLSLPGGSEISYSGADLRDAPKLARLCLFNTSFASDPKLDVALDLNYRSHRSKMRDLIMGFYTKSLVQHSEQLEITEYKLPDVERLGRQEVIFALDKANSTGRIVEVGIYCNLASGVRGPRELLDLYRLVIRPRIEAQYACSLVELVIYRRTSGENSEQRLRWAWRGSKDTWPVGLPWSNTTGPFSVFTITSEGKTLGQTHCLEFALEPRHQIEGKDSFEFAVRGHLFGGGTVLSSMIAGYSVDKGFE